MVGSDKAKILAIWNEAESEDSLGEIVTIGWSVVSRSLTKRGVSANPKPTNSLVVGFFCA